jgi:hypothetical protein
VGRAAMAEPYTPPLSWLELAALLSCQPEEYGLLRFGSESDTATDFVYTAGQMTPVFVAFPFLPLPSPGARNLHSWRSDGSHD